MQQKTNGIILQNTKFQEKKNILKIYTLQHGVQSYVVNIGHSKKSKIKSAHVIGLNQIEFIEQIKKTRSIQLISDIHVSYIYQNLFSNPIKNTIAIFLNEVLLKALKEQAMYHFISGYTAKVAGTEMGITEPTLTFSACFGKVFLPLHPAKYATLLGEKLKKNKVNVWLLNTGWVGGKYGVGSRIKLSYTRALINAALTGELDKVEYGETPYFKLHFPKACPGVPTEILEPKNAWKDKAEFDKTAQTLAGNFVKNFEQYASGTSADILAAAPLVAATV